MTNVICIVCPKGCHLQVDENNDYAVTGFGCARGIDYGKKELKIPKGMIPDAMGLLNTVQLKSPVKVGDVVVPDICGTGVPWVATRNM